MVMAALDIVVLRDALAVSPNQGNLYPIDDHATDARIRVEHHKDASSCWNVWFREIVYRPGDEWLHAHVRVLDEVHRPMGGWRPIAVPMMRDVEFPSVIHFVPADHAQTDGHTYGIAIKGVA